jgi:hypothetical protein
MWSPLCEVESWHLGGLFGHAASGCFQHQCDCCPLALLSKANASSGNSPCPAPPARPNDCGPCAAKVSSLHAPFAAHPALRVHLLMLWRCTRTHMLTCSVWVLRFIMHAAHACLVSTVSLPACYIWSLFLFGAWPFGVQRNVEINDGWLCVCAKHGFHALALSRAVYTYVTSHVFHKTRVCSRNAEHRYSHTGLPPSPPAHTQCLPQG